MPKNRTERVREFRVRQKRIQDNMQVNLNYYILRPAREWEILNCIKLTQHYKMH
jgi:hypothetical protein